MGGFRHSPAVAPTGRVAEANHPDDQRVFPLDSSSQTLSDGELSRLEGPVSMTYGNFAHPTRERCRS